MKFYIKYTQQETDLLNKIVHIIGEMAKYKCMWILRELEDIIESEGGQISAEIDFMDPPKFTIIGFSEATTRQIVDIINVTDFRLFQKPLQ